MSIARKLRVLRTLANDPRTPENERRAAAAAVAAYEAQLGDAVEPEAPATAPKAVRALSHGPIDAVVLILDRDSRAVADRRSRGLGYTLSVVEVTSLGEKRVLGRWLTRALIEWPDAELYAGFFGAAPAASTSGERVAALDLEVPDRYVLRKLFDASKVMGLFVETAEHGMVYFGRAFIAEIDTEDWQWTLARIVALDEATRVADLGPETPALLGDRPALAEEAGRPMLAQPELAALPPAEPDLDDR